MEKVILSAFDGNPGAPIPQTLGYPSQGFNTDGWTGYGTVQSSRHDDEPNTYTADGYSGTGAQCTAPLDFGWGAGIAFYHQDQDSVEPLPILGVGVRFRPTNEYGSVFVGWISGAAVNVICNDTDPGDSPVDIYAGPSSGEQEHFAFDMDPNVWFEAQFLATGEWFVSTPSGILASGNVGTNESWHTLFVDAYATGSGATLLVDDLYVLVETPPTPTLPNPTISRRIGRRLISKPQVRVGGIWLSTVAAWGDLVPVWGRNGCKDATWSMALGRDQRPTCLVKGAPVEIYSGPLLVWTGTLDAPDWNAGTFAAIGSAREGEGAKCLTAGGVVTSKPNTAINAAITRGVVSWTRVGDFGTDDLSGVEGDGFNDDPDIDGLNGLLNVWATEEDSQWYVYPDRRLDIRPEDETAPQWFILPGTVVLGVAADDLTDRVFLRYRSSVDDYIRTASYPASTSVGGIERSASIVKRGRMSAARALTIATAMYGRLQAGRTGWTNGIDAHHGQVIDKGGLVANLALIRGGDTVRVLDHADPRSAARYVDIVIGEVTWYPDENRVQLNPVGLAARTWESVMKQSRALAIDGPEYGFETTY